MIKTKRSFNIYFERNVTINMINIINIAIRFPTIMKEKNLC